MKFSLPIIVPFCFFILAGCTVMSEKQCLTADWSKIGFQDGKKGESFEKYSKREKQCSKHKVSAARSDYTQGYREGLQVFCTFDNGLEQGEEGEENNHVCPAELAKEFDKGHKAGWKVYLVKKQLEKEQEEREDEMERERNEMADKQDEMKREQQDRDEDALEKMSQCSSDSDCTPLKCSSEYMTVGTASGSVNKCVRR